MVRTAPPGLLGGRRPHQRPARHPRRRARAIHDDALTGVQLTATPVCAPSRYASVGVVQRGQEECRAATVVCLGAHPSASLCWTRDASDRRLTHPGLHEVRPVAMPSLQFKGKTFVDNHHLSVPFHELRPVAGKGTGRTASLHDNLVVHGDNLAALKALLPTYHNKVKCIYIDPPYNTGNEGWAYNDNVNSPMMQDWLGKTVDRDDLTRHDKWCCMMLPRLKLLRELLRQDGAIFISIDDNEVHHLRDLMDEVFGDENFVATTIWEKVYSPKSTAKHFSDNHDFIVVYARDKGSFDLGLLPRTEEADARYDNPDNDPRGPWKSGGLDARNPYSKGRYPIECPGGRVIPGPPRGSYWRYSREKLMELDADNRIWWGRDENQVPAIKRFLSEVKQGLVPQTIWTYRDVGHTQDAKKMLLQIFPRGSARLHSEAGRAAETDLAPFDGQGLHRPGLICRIRHHGARGSRAQQGGRRKPAVRAGRV